MSNKLISIVLPTYNGSKFLKKSLNSIIQQTYTNWELIIVDDCSTDDTPNIIKEYIQKDHRIRSIRNNSNKKLPASLNIGFNECKGDYLTWTSDDNFYKNDALEMMTQHLKENNCDFIYANMLLIDNDDNIIKKKPRKPISTLFNGCCIGACFLYKRELLDKFGGYDEKYFCAEDYEYWLRLWCNNVRFFLLQDYLYYYRNNPNSLSATKKNLINKNTALVKLKYWDSAPISNFEKTIAIMRQYKKTKSQELLKIIYQKVPIWGRIIKIFKG